MKTKSLFLGLLLLGFSSCNKHQEEAPLTCIQIIDQNGLSETINQEEKLKKLDLVDFLEPQPYKQVIRIYQKTKEGKTPSFFTTYYPNGQVKQYLEVVDGRASGVYKEWFVTGQPKIEAQVSGGTPDLSTFCQKDWSFDGICKVWDNQGNLIASIPYQKGILQGTAYYYYPGEKVKKSLNYEQGILEGEWCEYYENGSLSHKYYYKNNFPHGTCIGYFNGDKISFLENYQEGKLLNAIYYDLNGKNISEIQNGNGYKAQFENNHLIKLLEYKQGKQEGLVQIFDKSGFIQKHYSIKEEKKQGEEIEYFLPEELPKNLQTPVPKLSVHWDQDSLHGVCKTWYPNGNLASQKELHQNQKNGASCAWYQNGDLMYLEEYEADKLIQGKYFKKGQKEPISTVETGQGEATLFDEKTGLFLRRIIYRNGLPQG